MKIVLPILALLIGAGIAVALVKLRPEAEQAPVELVPPVATTVAADPQRRRIDAPSQGMVRARAVSPLSVQVTGVVTWVAPQLVDGALVAADAPLLRIEDADYRAAVATAEAELAGLRRQLAEEEAAAELAAEEWRALGEGEPTALALREPQLAAVRAQIAAAEAGVERARRDLARTELRAPFRGRVRSETVALGQLLAPGSAPIQLEAADEMEVVLPVTLEQLRYLDLPLRGELLDDGPAVTLRARIAEREVTWHGHVVRTLAGVDDATRMVRAVARIPLDPEGPPLLTGLYLEAEIAGREVDDVLALPATAIQPGDLCFVVVPAADGDHHLLEERQLQVLRRGRDEVLAVGLIAAGELVVSVRLPQMRDGMPVRLASEVDDAADTDTDAAAAAAAAAEDPAP